MDKLASILLLRARVLCAPAAPGQRHERFVRELETDAAAYGYVFTPALRDAIARVPRRIQVPWGDWLLGTLQADVGGDRSWVPLFRRFPRHSPRRTDELYVERMLAALFQDEGPICVLCGGFDTVQAVAPCGHLVCRTCFKPEDYTACPICHRRLDPTDPFLLVPEPKEPATGSPVRMQRLDLGEDLLLEARRLRDSWAGRLAPLTATERSECLVLIRATTAPGDLSWAPPMPARETKAVVTSECLRSAPADRRSLTYEAVAETWTTATDIARTVWAFSGGEPTLQVPRHQPPTPGLLERWRPRNEPKQQVAIPRVAALPRSLRVAILARLETLPMPTVIEDVLRHRTVWKRIAERLHPFEYSARFPRASVAFSVLRGSAHEPVSAPGRACLAAEERGWVRIIRRDGTVSARPLTRRVRVEEAMARGDAAAALDLLGDTPGDLLRRLDHLARHWVGDPRPVVDAAHRAALVASPRVGFAAMAAVGHRDRIVSRAELAIERATRESGRNAEHDVDSGPPGEGAGEAPAGDSIRAPRVYFPKGGAAFTWSAEDDRPLLPPGLPEALARAIDNALRIRAAALGRFELAIIDVGLKDIPIPAGTQSTSDASISLPRGSRLRFPADVETLRLFLHWVEPTKTRVDLDLSVVLFDEHWRRLDHCDYTRLQSPLGATHSGDLTSAPAPLGATEFLDLDIAMLRSSGVVWAAPVVFSYNDVPFENMSEAIAGVGLPFPGQHFDPAGVLVRYDLTGDSRASLPFTANLVEGTMRWLDLHLPSAGYAHSVGTRGDRLAGTVADLEALYAGPSRASTFTLAMTHAEARADRIVLRGRDAYTDLDGSPVAAPHLDNRVVLAVCVDNPPDPTTLDPRSLVVATIQTMTGVNDLQTLLTELDSSA